ncbi:DPP IV N-terminal domain-containing protein [Segatella paludivivens]|uniref:DPP IV N-terminal domain-containing protein n=1 Tax=Segatella paludivivens TaxID=185294 RepID=UPI00047220D5|nr:DPP IV N-terminal domain-containing protein [Segatella paludivivens]
MKMRLILLSTLFVVSAGAMAQGTLADYNRAYSLSNKFSNDNVYNSPADIKFKDSTSTYYYTENTATGKRYVAMDAGTNNSKSFGSKEELYKYLDIKLPEAAKPQFGRKHERHWMEVDEEKDTHPVISPDGKLEAYIEGENVVLHEVGKPYTEKRILSTDGTLSNYYSAWIQWSPDSKYIMTCKRRSVEKRYVYYVESSPADQLQPILHKQEYAKPGDELPFKVPCIFDANTGKEVIASTQLFDKQFSLDGFTWAADNKEVIFEYNERGHKVYRVLAMSAQTGKVRTIIEETATTFVNYPRHYRYDFADTSKMIWMSERDNWNHLYLYNVANGKVIKQITKGAWCVREVVKVDEKNNTIYFSACGVNPHEDPYQIHYYRINMDGKNMICLTPAEENHQAVFSYDMKYVVDKYSKVDTPPVTELRSGIDGKLISTIAKADISKLKESGWVAPEIFKAKGRDGVTDIWGIIQRPTNFDPTKKYPVIEYIYAGPGDAYTPKSFIAYNWNTTALAELGFIVVQMDGMGTAWRGKKFEELCYKNLKDAGFPDRELWIKAAAAKYPYIDASNVGIFGASAGGQESTTAVLLHGDFYKAAYSSCGCQDNRMDKIWWNELWMGYPVDKSYEECSNVVNAHKLQGSLMLVVGELDDNVDPSSTYQVANALEKAGKDFELVVLPGVHHTMGEKFGEHKRFDFFVKNLLKVNPPKWNEIIK